MIAGEKAGQTEQGQEGWIEQEEELGLDKAAGGEGDFGLETEMAGEKRELKRVKRNKNPKTAKSHLELSEIEDFRAKINDQNYLYGAIDRLAMVLCNEVLDLPQGGIYGEWEGGK